MSEPLTTMSLNNDEDMLAELTRQLAAAIADNAAAYRRGWEAMRERAAHLYSYNGCDRCSDIAERIRSLQPEPEAK
jgi:hypothetical protein